MCTVFAESEVISLVGRGEPRENIARGVIDSVVGRVAAMASGTKGMPVYLASGLCANELIIERLSSAFDTTVKTCSEARYAGAIGAARIAAGVA